MTNADAATAASILTIDLDALVANWRLCAAQAGVEAAAVLKADAYGTGAARVGPALAAAGCTRFFVAHIDEGLALRAALAQVLPEAEIGILNGFMRGTRRLLIEERLAPVLNDEGEVREWLAISADLGQPAPAYLHIDTGMNRLGLALADLTNLAASPEMRRHPWRGLISHFACADEPGHPLTELQAGRFRQAAALLPGTPLSLSASSGIFLSPDYSLSFVRPGAALYGINPQPSRPNPMAPVVRLEAKILQIRDIDANESVGYGAAHVARRPTRVATIAAGYADGYPRSAGARGSAWAGETALPILGRISMDLITLDASDARTLRRGDMVELLGPHRPVDQLAEDAGTNGYEILTRLGTRYQRRYIGRSAATGA